MKGCFAVLALAAIAALTGCGDVPMTYSPSDPMAQIDPFYDDGVGGRDIQLVVLGEPFPGMAHDQFARVVEADLQNLQTMRQPTRPVLAPGSDAKPIYRLVYVFNPSNTLFGNAICRRGMKPEAAAGAAPASAPPSAGGGTVTAVAAFCVEYRSVSEISGQTVASDAGDVRFYALTRQMMSDVFRLDARRPSNTVVPRSSP